MRTKLKNFSVPIVMDHVTRFIPEIPNLFYNLGRESQKGNRSIERQKSVLYKEGPVIKKKTIFTKLSTVKIFQSLQKI